MHIRMKLLNFPIGPHFSAGSTLYLRSMFVLGSFKNRPRGANGPVCKEPSFFSFWVGAGDSVDPVRLRLLTGFLTMGAEGSSMRNGQSASRSSSASAGRLRGAVSSMVGRNLRKPEVVRCDLGSRMYRTAESWCDMICSRLRKSLLEHTQKLTRYDDDDNNK